MFNEVIPKYWIKYTLAQLSINSFLIDFSQRIKQLDSLIDNWDKLNEIK